MKRIFTLALICLSLLATAQNKSKTDKKPEAIPAVPTDKVPSDTAVVFIRLTLAQASTLVYTLRYSTVMNASEGNQFADYIIQQINSQVTKPKEQQPTKH